MDRELDASYRYRRLGKKAAWSLGGVALGAAILVMLPGWLRSAVARAEIRTGRVNRGPVEGIVEASGVVIPAFEGVLSSPTDARVEKILKRPGQAVKEGEEILALDTSTSRLRLEKTRTSSPRRSTSSGSSASAWRRDSAICAARSRRRTRPNGTKICAIWGPS